MSDNDEGVTDAARWKYGVVVIGMGLLVLLLTFGAAVIRYNEASDAGAVLGVVAGTVAGLVGAYFGVQMGALGKKEAEDEARAAHKEAAAAKDESVDFAAALSEDKVNDVRERRRVRRAGQEDTSVPGGGTA